MGERGKRRTVATDDRSFDEIIDIRGERRTARDGDGPFDEIRLDAALARLATRQDGIVTRPQLVCLGFDHQAIDRRLASGSLIALFRGVYAVGHQAVSERGWMRAALLAVGEDGLLGHTTAARGWEIVSRLERPLHVTVVGRVPRSRSGLRVHTVRALDPRDRRVRDGLPLTSPARTLLDLAATEPADVLARAVREARVRWNVGDDDLESAIRRAARSHPGSRRLRAAVDAREAAPTRSALEREMLRLVDDAGLPRPLVNRADGSEIVDFTWLEQRVVVEVDGWHAHGDRRAFEADRARDAARQARGDLVVRFTWHQVTGERVRVATRLGQILAVRSR